MNGSTSALRRKHARCARHTDPVRGEGRGRCGSARAHTGKGHARKTRRATRPSPWNTQTAWNGVLAGEAKGHPDNRHTQPGECGGGDGSTGETQEGAPAPTPPGPAASTARTQTGHFTSQGSSGTPSHAPAPRLGSLRASRWGSHWRQASSTGAAAPAPRATTH